MTMMPATKVKTEKRAGESPELFRREHGIEKRALFRTNTWSGEAARNVVSNLVNGRREGRPNHTMGGLKNCKTTPPGVLQQQIAELGKIMLATTIADDGSDAMGTALQSKVAKDLDGIKHMGIPITIEEEADEESESQDGMETEVKPEVSTSKRSRPKSAYELLKGEERMRERARHVKDEKKLSALDRKISDSTKSPKRGSKGKSDKSSKSFGNKWTAEEDDQLRMAVQEIGEKNWKEIAKRVPSRNHAQCLQRWRKVLRPGLVKGHWSPEEDRLLSSIVESGCDSWAEVASRIPGRTSKQCRERWRKHLDPDIIKEDFTPEEDEIIVEAYKRFGNRWSQIQQLLPGRTEDAVKLRLKSLRVSQNMKSKPGRPRHVPGIGGSKHIPPSASGQDFSHSEIYNQLSPRLLQLVERNRAKYESRKKAAMLAKKLQEARVGGLNDQIWNLAQEAGKLAQASTPSPLTVHIPPESYPNALVEALWRSTAASSANLSGQLYDPAVSAGIGELNLAGVGQNSTSNSLYGLAGVDTSQFLASSAGFSSDLAMSHPLQSLASTNELGLSAGLDLTGSNVGTAMTNHFLDSAATPQPIASTGHYSMDPLANLSGVPASVISSLNSQPVGATPSSSLSVAQSSMPKLPSFRLDKELDMLFQDLQSDGAADPAGGLLANHVGAGGLQSHYDLTNLGRVPADDAALANALAGLWDR